MHRGSRSLRFELPMMRGRDVLAVQRRLRALGFVAVSQPDGLFGPATERAVRAFQQAHLLRLDGVVGPVTFRALFEGAEQTPDPQDNLKSVVTDRLKRPHNRFEGSVTWVLTEAGVAVDNGAAEGTRGEPETMRRVWAGFGASLKRWSTDLGVPAELVLATICTESGGKADAIRFEPGYTSDEETPHRVSAGLMQTLISTARDTLGLRDTIDRRWLLEPDNSIRAGTAYMAKQAKITLYDPPVVACAYNAGGVYRNDGAKNRWRMRQFPIDTGEHADRFVAWLNDAFRVLAELEQAGTQLPPVSLYRLAREG